jgi:bifunctional DNase/RNase
MRKVEVKALVMDYIQKTPVVLLQDPVSEKAVPVWIGQQEAHAIAYGLQEKEFPRPLTHDLLKNVIATLGGEIEKIVIDSLHDNVYYATLYVRDMDNALHEIDARPSDSMALAVRVDVPIFVADEVFDNAAIEMPEQDGEDDAVQSEQFKDFVEDKMNLSDFKKFIS